MPAPVAGGALRGLFARLFGRSAEPVEGSSAVVSSPPPPPAGPVSTNGTTLPPWGNQWPIAWGDAGAENVATVCACVDVIASAIATLPPLVYEVMSDGSRREAPGHPVARLLAAPNSLQSWPDLVRCFMGSVLLNGNAVVVIDRDGAGQASALYPVPWYACQPLLVPTSVGQPSSPIIPNSRLAFDVTWTLSPFPLKGAHPASGFPARYWSDDGETFFLRERSTNGILGISRLARAPLVLRQALSVQEFATYLWDNVGTPNLALTHPGRLGKETADNLAQSWRDVHGGPRNARKVVVLEEGMKADPLSASAEDSEVLDSRRFAAEEIARLFGVPPPLVGIWQYSSFTNSATASQWFGANTLAPWCKAIEAEFARSVFNDPARFQLEIDLSGLLRGDYATRAQVGTNLVRAGIITQNEARHDLGYPPMAGGDRLVMQSTGGRPPGTGDGEGDEPPAPANGTGGRPNGAALQ